MTSDLRTRIAKVIWTVFQDTPPIDATDDEWESWWNDSTQEEKALCYAQADAVIRELGLEQEFSISDDDGGRVLWLADQEPVTPREGEVVDSRWITRWEVLSDPSDTKDS